MGVSFPLSDWIQAHATAPHPLGWSGMGDTLPTVRRALRTRPSPDGAALRSELARAVGVGRDRLFLTHGATEANTAIAFYIAHRARTRGVRHPRAWWPRPEYPPLGSTATLAGFTPRSRPGRADLTILSDPNNPTGRRWPDAAWGHWSTAGGAVVVDETFREFTTAGSRAREKLPGVWTTGTFTKVYGGDRLRVGFAVAPEEEVPGFAGFHGVLLDGIPDASVQAARAILRDREAILSEVRAIFRSNRRHLAAVHPEAAGVDAPVWFDRPEAWPDGEAFAGALLRAGVLVCPGAYFGDPSGVRICLTRRSFPVDLSQYERVRDRRTPAPGPKRAGARSGRSVGSRPTVRGVP